MKPLVIIIFLITTNLSLGQEGYIGNYWNHFSEKIEIKSDSTFYYSWNFDLSSSWTSGTWEVYDDILYLKTKLIMDTLLIRNSQNKVIRDSLVISYDLKPEKIEYEDYLATILSSGGQNRKSAPERLFFKNEKLFQVYNGKLDQRKIKPIGKNKKYYTFFRKENE